MWALVTPEWWWIMAAWLQNKADFCVHVATEIAERSEPQDPEGDLDKVDEGYIDAAVEQHNLDMGSEPEPLDYSERLAEDPHYMTHDVRRVELPDGFTKVTGWCDSCNPSNCCGCAHIEPSSLQFSPDLDEEFCENCGQPRSVHRQGCSITCPSGRTYRPKGS